MAFAEVGSGSQRATVTGASVDSQALAFPGNITSGSLLIAAGAVFWGSGTPTISVNDTRSTSYTVLIGDSAEAASTFIAYGVAGSGGACTVTVDPANTGNYVSFAIDEFSGVHATPLDVNGSFSTGTGTSITDSITTVAADALIIGAMKHQTGGSVTLTPGGSYTQIGENQDNDSFQAFNAVFRIVTTATGYTVDWTAGSSVTSWAAQTVSFAPAAVAFIAKPRKRFNQAINRANRY